MSNFSSFFQWIRQVAHVMSLIGLVWVLTIHLLFPSWRWCWSLFKRCSVWLPVWAIDLIIEWIPSLFRLVVLLNHWMMVLCSWVCKREQLVCMLFFSYCLSIWFSWFDWIRICGRRLSWLSKSLYYWGCPLAFYSFLIGGASFVVGSMTRFMTKGTFWRFASSLGAYRCCMLFLCRSS